MLDYHMHSKVSYDGRAETAQMVAAAEKAGLREICFTDHLDYEPLAIVQTQQFDIDTCRSAYDDLHSETVMILWGMEFGMLPDTELRFSTDCNGIIITYRSSLENVKNS